MSSEAEQVEAAGDGEREGTPRTRSIRRQAAQPAQ